MNKGQFTKIAKKIVHLDPKIRNTQFMHPMRDWVIGLIVGTIVFSVSAVWSVTIYVKHKELPNTINDSEETENVVYRQNLVESVLEDFELRKKRHEGLISKSPMIVTSIATPSTTIPSQDMSTSTTNQSETGNEVTDKTTDDKVDEARLPDDLGSE